MTVKCLDSYAQEAIVRQFNGGMSISNLVIYWRCSRRTIIRVLEDAGVDPKIRRRPGRGKLTIMPTEQTVLQLAQAECALDVGANQWKTRPDPIFPRGMDSIVDLKHTPAAFKTDTSPFTFPPYPVHPILIPTPDRHAYGKPWYQRLGEAVRRIFRPAAA